VESACPRNAGIRPHNYTVPNPHFTHRNMSDHRHEKLNWHNAPSIAQEHRKVPLWFPPRGAPSLVQQCTLERDLQKCDKPTTLFCVQTCTQERSQYSDSLRAGRSGDRIPVEARFSAPVHTGPGAHPASYTMGTGSLSWR